MIHKHLANFLILQKQIEEFGKEEAYKFWQVRYLSNTWDDCTVSDLLFDQGRQYRLKPKTRTLKSDIKYPEPIWEKPKEIIEVFLIDTYSYHRIDSIHVSDWCFEIGVVQATEAGAKAQLAALQNALSGGKHE